MWPVACGSVDTLSFVMHVHKPRVTAQDLNYLHIYKPEQWYVLLSFVVTQPLNCGGVYFDEFEHTILKKVVTQTQTKTMTFGLTFTEWMCKCCTLINP